MARIDDGFSTTVDFTGFAGEGVSVFEKEVTPPGMDGGGPNDTTTMRNLVWRTMAPKKLKTLTQMSFVASYDPVLYNDLVAQINVNQLVKVTFPDGSSVSFYGWLDKFTPNRIVEGEQPTSEVTIQCSNQDTNGVETAPVYNAA